MKDLVFEIKPKEGLGAVNFGDTMEQLVEYLGEPEDVDNLEDDDEFSTVVLNYWDRGITAFVEGIEKQVISCFEISSHEAKLFGKDVFTLQEPEIKSLMQEKGYDMLDVADEEWGERRVTYEDAMIDFFFMDNKLVSVNWGVLVNDQGEIEDIDN